MMSNNSVCSTQITFSLRKWNISTSDYCKNMYKLKLCFLSILQGVWQIARTYLKLCCQKGFVNLSVNLEVLFVVYMLCQSCETLKKILNVEKIWMSYYVCDTFSSHYWTFSLDRTVSAVIRNSARPENHKVLEHLAG